MVSEGLGTNFVTGIGVGFDFLTGIGDLGTDFATSIVRQRFRYRCLCRPQL